MARIKLAPLTEEQLKSFESRKSKVESRTPKPLDLDALFNTDNVSTSAVSTSKSSYKGYTPARKKANAKWAKEKVVQIAIRVSPEVKAELDEHLAGKNESIAKFITRAIKEQIKRDNEQ